MQILNRSILIFMGLTALLLSSLTGCHTIRSIPSATYNDTGLGDGQIGKILKKANVWTYSFTYQDGGNSKNLRDKIYPLIAQVVEANKSSGRDINQILNQSDLGVICQNNLCRYQGYYYTTTFGGARGNGKIRKQVTEKGNYDISFNPYQLEQTYHIGFKLNIIEG